MARRELNAKTDIIVDYEEIKEGRKVAALRFHITKNPRAGIPDPLRDDPRLARLITRLTAHGHGRGRRPRYCPGTRAGIGGMGHLDLGPKAQGQGEDRKPRRMAQEDDRGGLAPTTLFSQEQAQARENERQDQEVKTARDARRTAPARKPPL